MAELCLSRSCISQIYRVVCTDFILLFSFVFCHPLYLSYFVFFYPYLYKLVSFLSPLFVTISLVLLALILDNFTPRLSEPGSSFLLSAHSAVFDVLSSKCAEDFKDFEELEVYKIVFLLDESHETETSASDLVESSEAEVSEPECEEKYCLEDVHHILALSPGSETRSSTLYLAETTEFPLIEEKKEMLHSTLEKEVDCQATIFNKVFDVEQESEAVNINVDCLNVAKEHTGTVKSRIDSYNKIVKKAVTNERRALSFDNESSNLGSYGSMRKEKEWKRTLACKLFEERHSNVVGGGEGMDSLWETYESDSTKPTRKDVKNKNTKKKTYDLDDNCNAGEDDDEIEMTNGHLCCLQAFKFSARKMNMGMGRTNIVKITKALKGIGWLHNVKRHDKKEKP
ncbi:hypothetical protein ACET3Z_004563 [Daucus carota]